MRDRTCVICGKEFRASRQIVNITCSPKCRGKQHSKDMTGRFRGENSSNWKGGRTIQVGYPCLFKPDHPNANNRGYIREHRYLMSEHLGRPLLDTEVVHHVNGDPFDNRLENLVVLTRSTHAKEHGLMTPEWRAKRHFKEPKDWTKVRKQNASKRHRDSMGKFI